MQLLVGVGESFPTLPYDILRLEPYAVQFRYDFGTPFDDAERSGVIAAVQELRAFGIARILTIEDPTQP